MSSALVLATEDDIPIWLRERLAKLPQSFFKNVVVSQYIYKDKVVYVFDNTRTCCDLGATMYAADGAVQCSLIGIAGRWQAPCSDFVTSNKLVKVLYGEPK